MCVQARAPGLEIVAAISAPTALALEVAERHHALRLRPPDPGHGAGAPTKAGRRPPARKR